MASGSKISKKLDIFLAEKFEELKLEDILGDRFGRYSKYIIQERAIPDIRDGLKPVQRRILYAMNELKLFSNQPYKKSARITGEVMGKYHPHGDSSIYEALVRMSQSWKMSVSLIDMHGNNGSIDGDGPAAMRYTETRMSKNAEYLLKDIDKKTVPFIPNFDEEEIEPTVLPAKFPNLLVNGAMGISSGYATYIPTHNFNEVINATIALIDNPNLTIDELLEIMPGPDFPTGGIVQGKEGIREAFLTGAGTVVVRSKYEIEEIAPEINRIVISEIPYDTYKQKTVEKMEQLRLDGKIPDVSEIRDESGRDGLRIAIDLKKNANVDAIMTYLFKNTDLQVNLNYNMVSICERRPMRLGVIPILNAYINHQKDVVTNRTNFLLEKAKTRLHIVEGFMKMIDVVDEVIKTIRASKNKADSKNNIINKFGFSELQAEAIVTMQLYRLSNQDIEALRAEEKELNKNIVKYEKILNSEKELLKVIKGELDEVNKTVVQPRKSKIEEHVSSLKVDETELIAKEQVIVSVSKEGYLKRISLKSFNAGKNVGLKDNDATLFTKEVSTLDKLLIFTNLGNFIYLPVYKISECKLKDIGTFINSLVQIQPKERFIKAYSISEFNSNTNVLLVTNEGSIKQCSLNEFEVNRYTKPVRAMKLQQGEELVDVDMTTNPLEIMVFTRNAEALRFRASEVSLYGTNAGGVKSILTKPKDYVVSAIYCNKNDDFLLLTTRNTIKRMKVSDVVLTKRARTGSSVIKLLKSNPYLLVQASKLTPNQYKENVVINLIYKNGNDSLEAFSLKYNASDSGKTIVSENTDLKELFGMTIPEANEPDKEISGDYLIEIKDIAINDDDGSQEETPIVTSKTTKKEKKANASILDELNDILFKETGVKQKNVLHPDVDNNEDDNKSLKYKKISLFDDF